MADRKRIDPRRPIPSSGYDRLRDNLSSGFAEGFPVKEFPNPDNRSSINKGRITTRKDDNVQDVSIGLQDHDEAIMYYFNNVIQKDGYFRDKEGKLQTPIIMFKRDSVEKRRDLGNKLDANSPQLYYTFQEKYSKRNQYDNFNVLQNIIPQKEFHTVVIPDYVTLQYSCIIWTDYIAQMNKLIEMINYSSDSYWGDKETFKFNAKIDTYSNTTEVAQGENRVVKTNFGLTIQGYLIPDSLNKDLAKKPQKFFSKSRVVFNSELIVEPTGQPLTREQVRGAPVTTNINQIGTGVGYQILGESNQIA